MTFVFPFLLKCLGFAFNHGAVSFIELKKNKTKPTTPPQQHSL